MGTDLSPEQTLLLQCCTSQLQPETGSLYDFLKSRQVDWGKFVKLTSIHKLFPVVHNALREYEEFVPADIREEISDSVSRNVKRIMNLSGELIGLQKLFETGGIRVLAFKGPLMIMQLFGDYRFRQTRDLDLLVEPQNIDAALDILQNAGYILEDRYFNRSPEKRALYMARENHVRLHHGLRRSCIELHWAVSKYFTSIPVKTLFDASQSIDFHGCTMQTLTPEDYSVILAVHGIYHRFENLFWLYDLAHILKKPEVNVVKILHRATEFRCLTAVRVALSLAANLLNATYTAEPAPTWREEKLYKHCVETIFASKPITDDKDKTGVSVGFKHRLYHHLYFFFMTDDPDSRKRVILNSLVKPYVWPANANLPRNNFAYLLMTQLRWICRIDPGKTTSTGPVRSK